MVVTFWILSLPFITTQAQYSLYYTNLRSENDVYYDCLYYKVLNDIAPFAGSNVIPSFYQITPYCIRPLKKTEDHEIKVVRNRISANFTFDELKKLNITARDLLLWFAPIDLIEDYQNYLINPTLISASEVFYNCTSLWFGSFCQYTFGSNEPFNNIVRKTFIAKWDESGEMAVYKTTNLSCYIHIECNRGPPPMCLDWREICDGRMDCLNDGIDEKHCFDLEINECEENEYRCHNGMCIPERFLNDNADNPDCLDRTDENDNNTYNFIRSRGSAHCYQYPSFQCEETNPFDGLQTFVCGDGQRIILSVSEETLLSITLSQCANRREHIWFQSLSNDPLRSVNLTPECQRVMKCIALGRNGFHCIRALCMNQGFPCSIPIQTICKPLNYVIVHALSIIQSYVQFGYWTNKTIVYKSLEEILLPDFVCYDIQQCPFFLPTSHFHMNNLTCFNIFNISLSYFKQMVKWFHRCSSIDAWGNQTDCFHPSLYHCPNSTKCISKHRLLDGFIDCPFANDELYTESCQLNHRHRFQCTSENKCISPVLIRNFDSDCSGQEDEVFHNKKTLPFQNLCNGYTDLTSILINGQNETDESNCEQWPCSNPYTQCNKAWNCRNGVDEVNCDPTSECYPNRHECISPKTFQIMCLPIEQTGDGKIDCLGAVDEREHCRNLYSDDVEIRYRCWNDTRCVRASCSELRSCPFELHVSFDDICFHDKHIERVVETLGFDRVLGYHLEENIRYFVLFDTTRFRSNASLTSLMMSRKSDYMPIENISHMHTAFSFEILLKKISFRDAWICDRGILIYSGEPQSEYCLCPPSHYGNRCQFQSHRASLTLQFDKECAPACHGVFGIVIMLLDSNQVIQSYEQLTYISTNNCDMKYNLYLLYRLGSKNLTKNYTIRIDAYNKIDLTYYTSWKLPVKFLFLPVNRIAAHLIIPANAIDTRTKCPFACGEHGSCAIYVNTKEYFCRCYIRENDCDCSADSLCLGKVNNQSICLCPINKFGHRCFMDSICHDNPCKNDGQCIPEDARISTNGFICICRLGYSGSTCNVSDTRIDISFNQVKIPQSIKIHLIAMKSYDNPLISTIMKKIPFDQDSIVFYTSLSFNLIFIQVNNEFYLAFLQHHTSFLTHIPLEMKGFHRCSSVENLLDKQTNAFPLLRRVKYYHMLCQKHIQLSCLHDNEAFMCLCHEDGYANCLHFDFNETSICSGRTICENNGQCLLDRAICPISTMCICPECFYGGRCQFTTKSVRLSLDAILGYHIRPYRKIIQQSIIIKVSITLTTLILIIGFINGILSIMTFQVKTIRIVGCGLYLLTLSISSLASVLIFTLKFWLLVLSQIGSITNRNCLEINCIFIEFLLRSFLTFGDWLNACVAIERMVVVIKDVKFNQTKSRQIAPWIIISVSLCIFLSLIHDPIHRDLVFDEQEQRTWCVVSYTSAMRIFDSFMHILQFFVPFSINIVSSLTIILMIARKHSISRKQRSYHQHLRRQFREHKHLIISPILLVILAFPRLIISFLSGCMKSTRDPWLYLIGYFISFLPPLSTFPIFICSSETYKKEFDTLIQRYRTAICRRLRRA